MRTLRLILLGAAWTATSAGALGETANIVASRDNTLYQDPAGAISNGAGTGMFAGRSGQSQNSIRRGLVFFDVASAVPAGSTITGATLTLHQSSANDVARDVSLHRTLASWGEGASNATIGNGGSGTAAAPGDATWLHRFFSGTTWNTAGGDFSPAASATTTVIGSGYYSWAGAALVSDAQFFLDHGAANFGWLLRGDESISGTSKRFSTHEEGDDTLRPVLTLEYLVPGPGATTPLLAAAIVFRRRR